jgi:hypothetical protein
MHECVTYVLIVFDVLVSWEIIRQNTVSSLSNSLPDGDVASC